MSRRQRLLMLAYFFPPVVSVGIERSLQHARHLPHTGWDPVVVSPATSAYRRVEPASVDRIPPGTEVRAAPSFEPGHIRAWARAILRPRAQGAAPRSGGPSPPPAHTGWRAGIEGIWATAVRLLFFPDEQLGWLPGAVLAGRAAHRRQPVDAIYSSSPPVSGHLAAAILRGALGVPWVADFRDPWIGNAYAAPLPVPHRWLQAWLERAIVRRADATVFASRRVMDEYAARYPDRARRFITIPNGYDAEELASVVPPTAPAATGPFRLVFSGSIQYVPELELVLDALEILLARRSDLPDRLRVEYVGWFSPPTEGVWQSRAARLAPVLERSGFLPRAEAIRRLRTAGAGMVVLAGGAGRESVPPAKLFEYIGLDLPVLAIAPPGEARRILDELEWGVAADPTPESVADALERLVDSPPAPGVRADPDGRYERRTLSRLLADVLDEVVGAGRYEEDAAAVGSGSRARRPTPR